jgi:hypothetical protein
MKNSWLDKYEDGGEYLGTTNVGRNYSPAWGGQFQMGGYVYPVNYVPQAQMGGSIPGSVGFTYARTGSTPSEGPYAKKTLPSAQKGKLITKREDFNSWWPWLANIASGGSDRKEEPRYGKLTDLYRYYAGEPLKYNVIEISQYKPSSAKDPNANYISINDSNFLQEVVDAYNRASKGNLKSSTHGKEFKYSNKDTYNVSGYNNRKEAWAMGHYNVSKGKDDKGEYISYYDKFDATPGKSENLWENIGIVKPFEIYGRIYLDPKTGKPKLQNGGSMSFYQHGLDWTPKNISKNGSVIKDDRWKRDVTPVYQQGGYIKSSYKPSIEKSMLSDDYYTNPDIINEIKNNLEYAVSTDKTPYYDGYKIDKGKDNKGEYYSVYNPKPIKKGLFSNDEFYDRIYKKDLNLKKYNGRTCYHTVIWFKR